MPRVGRIAPADFIFHVLNRGNARGQIFEHERDYEAFERVITESTDRVHESLQRTLGDVMPEELGKEPHPSIGWLAWRISRVMDANVAPAFRPRAAVDRRRMGCPIRYAA
jgi:hypothetical protein